MAFHVGQKVECVQEAWRWDRWIDRLFAPRGRDPAKGGRHVVDAVVDQPDGLYLGIVGFGEIIYAAEGFRPLVDGQFERLVEIAADPPKALARALQPAGVV